MLGAAMYREHLLDHYKNPRNKGTIKNPDIIYMDDNPLCGDEIEITAKLNGKKIKEIRFNGKGCAISQASASMLTETLEGKSLDEVKKFGTDDIVKMLGIELSPIRVKCAVLSLKILQAGIEIYKRSK